MMHPHAILLCALATWLAATAAPAQTILFDLGNDSSYRGASVASPDANGNHWNSVWSGAYYPGVVDIGGNATSVNFGFSTAPGNDSYNGPAGDTTINGPGDSVYNATALGNLGVDEGVYDYYVSSSFEIQQLDPSKTYDLTFYGAHKYNDDNTTRYSVFTDSSHASLLASVDLQVGAGASHNQSNVARITGLSPQADNSLYIDFAGAGGGNGYLNAFRIEETTAPPEPVRPKVYMHYMPWFNTPQTLGAGNWGLHWRDTRGNTTNPNLVDDTGKRQIASNFYPKIGPYDTTDPTVLEYHLLLMKVAGIDGVLIDWYGVEGANGDVGSLLTNSNAVVDKVDDYGLEFGVVLEDRFSTNGIGGPADINKAKANVAYLRDNYFNNPQYIRSAADEDPLLLTFGPITFEQESEWTEILAQAGEDVDFLPLWYESGDAGANADGEYSWVYENENLDNHLSHLTNFYQNRVPGLGVAGASAYPGFDVFGGAEFQIPHDNGQTLTSTLALAQQNSADYDFLQLVTWNDFGEGTVIEPTLEAGFSYLVQIQQFTGSPFGEEDLETVYRLYVARQKYAGDAGKQAELDQVSQAITSLDLEQAQSLLDSIAPPGDYDGDGDVDLQDYGIWRQSYGSETVLHGSGADGNFDGQIDAADYALWRKNLAPGVNAPHADPIPEPSSAVLSIGFALLSHFALTGRSMPPSSQAASKPRTRR